MTRRSSYASLYDRENLRRAWGWIRSNPDAGYKTYFRQHYANYAVSQEDLLQSLSEKLRRGAYHPAAPTKIYLPKPSGILRPYTLLEVEDQIVYQAAVNIIAEKLHPKVRHRYRKQVFGHLYAGKDSIWFYKKWSDGYTAFNGAATNAFNAGNVYAATFDLTAFYDSIDHHVLDHFLLKLAVPQQLVNSLKGWLRAWSHTGAKIVQGHGIPQGPLGSGLLAETVLAYLDDHQWQKKNVTYLRYVDDIKLFAETETDLRKALIDLDHLSKDIGLFPQSSKINIHRVMDVGSELKTVSQPVQSRERSKAVDQHKVRQHIKGLTPRYRVADATRFKFALANATANAELTNRLWQILDRAPEFYVPVARYLSRLPHRSATLPRSASLNVVKRITDHHLYPAIPAAFLRSLNGTLHPSVQQEALQDFKTLWRKNTRSTKQNNGKSNGIELTVALGTWLIQHDCDQTQTVLNAAGTTDSGWALSSLLNAISSNDVEHNISQPAIKELITECLKSNHVDVAIAAAVLCGRTGTKASIDAKSMNPAAVTTLRNFGLSSSRETRPCGINASIALLLKRDRTANWRRFFPNIKRHRQAERQLVSIRGYASTDATAWVQGLDVFNDLLLDALFYRVPSLGGYRLGNIGGCTTSPPKSLREKFPETLAFTSSVHSKRYESNLAHPKIHKTNRPTRTIEFAYIKKSLNLFSRAINELLRHGLL